MALQPLFNHPVSSRNDSVEWSNVLQSKQASKESPVSIAEPTPVEPIVPHLSCSSKRESDAWASVLGQWSDDNLMCKSTENPIHAAICLGSSSIGYVLEEKANGQRKELARAYHDTMLGAGREGPGFQEDALRETAAASECCAREIRRHSKGGKLYIDVVGTAAFRHSREDCHGTDSARAQLALQRLCAPLVDLHPTEVNVRVLTGEQPVQARACEAWMLREPTVGPTGSGPSHLEVLHCTQVGALFSLNRTEKKFV
eukprot:CAMPEP_0202395444 /NCGR_PEP_ID=MMETSP1127-20130417/93966_1 /ASSEMBLY_ACC=CAM_ASM_000462 /TAXON_ID=3047 /ORGANISM="Dunaliella tertiolecta, Strain CCMP1320" /LENGTH=256 /DNA_ID=CAMNT_0048998133 /DNA_START=120 /DNA_END=890 /DNA_ORIENTATION=+